MSDNSTTTTHGHNATASGHSEHYQPQVLTMPHADLTEKVLRTSSTIGVAYKKFLFLFGGLFIAGGVAFVIKAANEGFEEFKPWGYFMATFAFIFTTAMSAPIFAVSQRMVRSHWRRPMTRTAELLSVGGIIGCLMFIPLALMLPDSENRKSIWFQYPFAPTGYLLLAVFGLAILGMALLYVNSIPDLAAVRDHGTGWRKKWAGRLAPKFKGTSRDWKGTKALLLVLGALYFLFLIGVHTMIASDFALALVPGWKDAIFPAWQAIGGLQSALACTILFTFLMWKFGGYKAYISVDQFWAASKILLALSLLWAYHWVSGFMTFWYGRQPVEQAILKLFFADSYVWAWAIAIIGCFITPFLMLIWNAARKSIIVPTAAACVILFATLVDKVRIYVATFTVADVRADALKELHAEPLLVAPRAVMPGATDIFIILGGISGVLFLVMLAAKFIPTISMWEVTEGMLYRKRRKFMKREIMVMGKPD